MQLKPAVKAGKPESVEGYEKTQVNGVELYLSKDFNNKSIKINWLGWWKIGWFEVSEKNV